MHCKPMQKRPRSFLLYSRGGAPLRPPLPGLQTRKYTPAPLAGLQCRPLQAKGKACVKNIAISKFHRRGEHCSPAKALCCRKAPRVEQSPTPTMHRKRMRLNSIAISQFHRRGGAWLRPPLPGLQTRKSTPRTVGGPAVQAPTSKRQGLRKKNIAISKFHRRGEHCSPALAGPATPKIHPPHRWRACHAGPYKQKARLA